LLAERSAEDIAAALARLYRARLPSPEDILDPGQGSGRSREDRGREREGRPPRGDDRSTGPRSKKGKSSPRHAMGDGSVWFSASIGSRKNAEARWLLPMICRRGGIDKSDIGAIRIMDTTTEFEISARAAESFAVKIRRPDKEDNIRIEALAGPSPREEVREKEWTPKPHGKNAKASNKPAFDKKPHYDTKRRDRGEQAHAGKPRHQSGASAKPEFGKKKKKKFRG
jgi:ATP-dependent RNA helicase DeaD